MKGDYHLIYTWETRQLRLYNVRKDIGESTDLAASKPKLVRRLAQELTDSLQACRAQRPVLRSTGQPIAWARRGCPGPVNPYSLRGNSTSGLRSSLPAGRGEVKAFFYAGPAMSVERIRKSWYARSSVPPFEA